MSRITPRPDPQLIRQMDVQIVLACRSAVDRAMERFHRDNPALYHDQRPTYTTCPFDADCPFTRGSTR